MRLILLGLILSGGLTISAQEHPVISQPDRLAGPWEVAGPSSVDGIFFMISGSQATAQSIQVRVYHRKPGRGSAGWYSIRDTPVSSFDGTTLRLLGLTATFDPAAAHWNGEWVIDGEPRKVILERPRPVKSSTPESIVRKLGKSIRPHATAGSTDYLSGHSHPAIAGWCLDSLDGHRERHNSTTLRIEDVRRTDEG